MIALISSSLRWILFVDLLVARWHMVPASNPLWISLVAEYIKDRSIVDVVDVSV